ncbi:BREX-1 system phosphatase PglZ type A [Enterocloster bolteae]|uniref:BREX-1 system phosphatase PglZ type A n=1 Tax=Enterocloster bolteae TaxID=208479 RepID=UPI003AB17A89
MDADKVIQDLNRRFAAPLPEFYQRRIIFWYDEDQEFADKLDEIVLENAKIVVLTGSNAFAVKKLLNHDDLTSNYLVYSPVSYDRQDDNWLLDIELYSEEFRADLISIWMDEMDIPPTPAMRKQVKHYRKYFNAKDRRARIVAQNKVPSTPAQLHMAVMAAICGLKNPQPNQIIRSVFRAGLDVQNNAIYREFINYGSEDAFWAMVRQGCGFYEEEHDLGRLAIHLLLTASTRTMRPEYLAGLDSFISMPHQAYCYDFISEWLHGEDREQLYDVARYVEDEAHLNQRFAKLAVDDLVNTECFPCINEVILTKLMTEISNHIIDVDTISATVEKRRTCAWYESFENFYDGLLQVANMQRFFKEHSAGFHTADAKGIWKEYTESYYQMDTFYRLFHLSFQKSLETSNILLDDLFKHVADKVEGLYSHWFLGGLGNNWSDVCADELEQFGKVLEIAKQEDFYRSRIKNSDTRVFVIISDALRYEVAASLADQLRRETQSKVSLSSMQSIFPSITKFGMAALLPHKELSAEVRNDILTVFADAQSTASTNRDKVLKNENPSSVALQYKNIIGMKRAERSALVKGMDVVYLYHDTIDDASHTSDTSVFPACDKAISELKNLVRIIVNEFGGTRIMITADHGFLYTYSPLTEDDKVDKTSFNGMDVEYGRRYAIMQKGAAPKYLMPVKFLDGKSEFDGFAPRESIRIKMNGGGLNFVHGGISLQEMVVPVIEYRYLRNDSMEYKRNKQKYDTKPVTVSLLSANRKISNMIFSLNFYQKDAVGDNREATTYLVYFTDESGKQISDVQKIIADKASDNGADRTFRCNFNLKSLKYSNTATYYLVIADEQGLQMPQREQFQIDIAFAVDEFDFFS